MITLQRAKAKFLMVKCDDCNSEQVIYNSAAMETKCLSCGKVLAKPSSGKAKIMSKESRALE